MEVARFLGTLSILLSAALTPLVANAQPAKSAAKAPAAGAPSAFHEIDQQVILGAFDSCFDPGFIYPCCKCNDGIWPLTEYWWPVSKVENVDVPHKTGYLAKEDVAKMKSEVERVYTADTSRDWLRNVAPRNVLLTRRSSQSDSLNAIRATATPPPTPANRAKINPFAREEDGNYNEFHAFTEPLGRALDGMYWSKTMYGRLACHWNLPELPETKSYLSEAPIGFETSRRAQHHNLVLGGKDNLRPGVGYDQDGLYKTGGWISEYVALSTSEKMECMQLALDDTPGESDSARDRCLRKNPGGWVPTSNKVKSPSPALAASVGTLRGIKLAYYYFPADSFCKGQGMLDSSGYCYNPLIHGGNFYDFEPSPYAVAYADHLANDIPGLTRMKG